MTFVLLVLGAWLLLLAGMCGWVWRKRRGAALEVSQQWIAHDRYPREGDVPPGTSRQEEGR